MKQLVKLYGLLFFLSVNWLVVNAQQKHFIYIQSEDRQPFAVVMSGKVFSSSDYGYIIIPKLDDGDYKFTVSFPMNKFPDQSFTCSVSKKDVGYYLKNNKDTWALENMQTQKLIASGAAATTATNTAFGDMLSDVVSDSNLNKTVVPTSSAASAGNSVIGGTVVAADAAVIAAATVPHKIAESKADDGTKMLFVDKSESASDTISVFIPAEKAKPADETLAQNTTTDNITQDSLSVASVQNTNMVAESEDSNPPEKKSKKRKKSEEEITDKSATDVSNPFYKPDAAVVAATAAAAATEGTVAINNNNTSSTNNIERSDCENVISDDDLNKVKRKMFSQDNDDDMVKYAVKSLGKKCISTEQVKALGSLFSSDDGRYNLYDALYKHVADYSNYSTLANQILDPYYKKRFAALLR